MRRNVIATLCCTALAVGVWLVPGSPAAADTFVVTSTTDSHGPGTLRSAFDLANANPGPDTIVLGAGLTYVLDLCGDDDTNAGGDLDGNEGPITIEGNGSTIRQTCDGRRVIDQNVDELFTLLDTTITGGTEDDAGGGISADGDLTVRGSTITGNTAFNAGGGLHADGDLVLTDSVVTGNESLDEQGGGINVDGNSSATIADSLIAGNQAFSYGGGMAIYGALFMDRTTVIDNVVTDADFYGGGGLYVDPDQDDGSYISHSTIADNRASGPDANGGGIYMDDESLAIDNSTITGNVATGRGGGLANPDYPLTLDYVTVTSNSAPEGANFSIRGGELIAFGSVIADPRGGGDNCDSVSSGTRGYNYEQGGDSCGFSDPTDRADAPDPQLGALGDNGGPTPTRMPAADSPLVDAIPTSDPDCRGDDQRGVTRPQFDGCDIGAVEYTPVPPPSTTTTSTTPPTTGGSSPVVVPRFTG